MVLDTSAFFTVQLKGKLMKKVLKALPNNVDHRRELLLTVYNKTPFEDKLVQLPKSKHDLNLSRNTASKVINFFCDNETSRVSPNVNCFVKSIATKRNSSCKSAKYNSLLRTPIKNLKTKS